MSAPTPIDKFMFVRVTYRGEEIEADSIVEKILDIDGVDVVSLRFVGVSNESGDN